VLGPARPTSGPEALRGRRMSRSRRHLWAGGAVTLGRLKVASELTACDPLRGRYAAIGAASLARNEPAVVSVSLDLAALRKIGAHRFDAGDCVVIPTPASRLSSPEASPTGRPGPVWAGPGFPAGRGLEPSTAAAWLGSCRQAIRAVFPARRNGLSQFHRWEASPSCTPDCLLSVPSIAECRDPGEGLLERSS